jgi:hypothetical protein
MKSLSHPPAVWTAFATQARWKNWVLAGQLACIIFLTAVCLTVARKPPDIIVVGETGTSTFVSAMTSSAALQDFLRQQRDKASDVTLLAFTTRFVKLTAAINSTTVDESWAEALTMMAAPLATRVAEEAKTQKIVETYRLAKLRSALEFREVNLMERRGDKAHVRVRVARHKELLMGDGGAADDSLLIDLVLVDVPRSRQHPDGLEVLDWRSRPDTDEPARSDEKPNHEGKTR